MAPNPIMIPRKPVGQPSRYDQHERMRAASSPFRLPLLAASIPVLLLGLFATLPWARRWILSGAGMESLLIIYGAANHTRILPDIPLWTLLATFNLLYAVCSTSWLLYALFATTVHPFMILTCLNDFPLAAKLARRGLRKVLGGHSHFIKDKLALFNLPALEIDTDVDGLFVVRGLTMSFSSLTLVAHGIELGIKLADDMELAIYVDDVTVRFLRGIEIGDIYANVKGDREMTFTGPLDEESDDAASEFSVFLDDTPLLRAATAGSKGFTDRPKLRETLTGVSYMRDSSAKAGLDIVETIGPNDAAADQRYHDKLTQIRTDSAVYQSRSQVRHKAKSAGGLRWEDEKDMRAAVCAELHNLPSVPHPPPRSIRVTTLQNLSPPSVRRFLHRLPFLLRLLLAPLSYFHPINIASINAAGSGRWLSTLLQKQVFKRYTEKNAQLRRLQRKLSTWLADANFCVQLTGIEGLGQVPLSTLYNIVTYLQFDHVMAYRTVPHSHTITRVVQLSGADATLTIPSYLLPHHEHIVPAPPNAEDAEALEAEVERADGAPKAVQVEHELQQVQKDESNIAMSVHLRLPVKCDQSLLNFVAALVKATKMIELEREVDEAASPPPVDSPLSSTFPEQHPQHHRPHHHHEEWVPGSPESCTGDSVSSITEVAGFKMFARNIRQNLRDGTTKANLREFARDVHHTTRDSMKKTAIGGLVHDGWIAKVVGKAAAMLQKAQGDVGYSGNLPVALAAYRGEAGLPSKLLP